MTKLNNQLAKSTRTTKFFFYISLSVNTLQPHYNTVVYSTNSVITRSNNNNNDNLNTPGSRTVSSCEQYGTNLRRGLARDLGKWLTEIVSFKPALESLE